jgi:hypothetical protein
MRKAAAMAGTRPVRLIGALIGLIALGAFTVPGPAPAGVLQKPPEPVIGPERPVSYPVFGTPQPLPGGVAIASGGGVHLVVMDGVRAVRVGANATLIDPSPLPVSEDGVAPDVAFDGENFLVVWHTSEAAGSNVRARRVGPDGHVLDAVDIVVSPNVAYETKVSFDGENFLVVWQGPGGLHRALVSPDGTVVDPSRPLVSDLFGSSIDIAFNGSHHLLVWAHGDPGNSDTRDVYGTLVTTDGTALQPGGVPISATPTVEELPSVAALGSTFLVAWADSRSLHAPDIFGARVDGDGTVLDPDGFPITMYSDFDTAPDVASDGSNFMVAWNGRLARVAPSGAVLDDPGTFLPNYYQDTVLTFDGQMYFAVNGAAGTRITTEAVLLDPSGVEVFVAASSQTTLDTASDGTNTFVVWTDDRRDAGGLYGARVGPDGQVLDGTGIRISEPSDVSNASVGFDGTTYLAVWSEERASGGSDPVFLIMAARVSREGVVLDQFEVSRREGGFYDNVVPPRVASGGGLNLVTWIWLRYDYQLRYHVPTLHAARVGPDGAVLDPSSILLAEQVNESFDVARGEDGFLVVWTDRQEQFVSGTIVTDAGALPDPDGFVVSDRPETNLDPRVAWNGQTHLVVWANVAAWNDPDTWNVYGARVDGSGAVLDPDGIPIATGPGAQDTPTIAANGPFLVIWVDRRRLGGERGGDLRAARVDPDGSLAHPDGFTVVAEGDGYLGAVPALGPASSAGEFSVTYERFVAEQPFGSTRAFVRTVSPK